MTTAAPPLTAQQSRLIFLAILAAAVLLWARRRTPITISVRGDNTLITLDRGAAIFGAKWNTITLHEEV